MRVDVALVGAGIVGLATARALQLSRPDLTVVVLDKEDRVAAHQTGRSSGVVHRGVYYTPGSLKAELCPRGSRELLAYCEAADIPVLRCGKVVVAVSEDELPRLAELHRRSLANGVPRVALIGREELAELEPHVAGIQAIHSPETAVVDFRLVAEALAADLGRAGVDVMLQNEVTAIEAVAGRTRVEATGGDLEARLVVACAGVHADRVARLSGGAREPRIVPFRGDYLALRAERRYLSRGLVYPVPDPEFPFLGVHTTVRPDGDVWLGPNAVLALAREGYRRRDVRLSDVADVLGSRGFRRLVRRHWRTGSLELARDLSTRLFVRAAQRLIPELEPRDVVAGPAGIRAQALTPDGALVDDFVFDESDGVIHVRNAPSPGATSSLAIGALIAERALGQLDCA